MAGWENLYKALDMFREKKPDLNFPFHCEHDTLYVQVDPELFNEQELQTLDELGFHPEEEFEGAFYSFMYGSA